MKFGKLPARIDRRTIKLASILRKVLPPIPAEWDVDAQFPFQIPYRMFRNGGKNAVGDCVEVAKYNQMLRFEANEQKLVVAVKDSDVVNKYFGESDGQDIGLEMLSSENDWRQNGIPVGSRKIACIKFGGQLYYIYAFSSIETGNPDELKACVYLLNGSQVGLQIPQSAIDAWNNGRQRWDDVGDTNLIGGHAVACKAYNEIGPRYLTWGEEIQATWAFHKRYNDEGYGAVDKRDLWVPDSVVDEEKLNGILKEITA